ncbi:MAG: hypothetical protein A2849_03200 [Candidatus Taylorbacteria bacterium RIFCSPHIGHO2_01_FULL_51_15]|uniref:Uncharacterized protein n=1 Tax=Candidatus Taylorbacteria bacterium RIFCSPHIGHO2_01_FULL_51_15 TaxID=1802304 RepID=A0A1G2MBK3_9BACT|nr:MAG: hypothetical protein A2849_03200 [Candidatus Taylorbacteria bacterium RIFCSPHIGHO2_01_FULL_51_15]
MYIKVHVIPESREEGIAEKGELLYVSVACEARQGAANRRMLELLRAKFGAGAELRIVGGHHAPHKIISLDFH